MRCEIDFAFTHPPKLLCAKIDDNSAAPVRLYRC